MNSPCRCTHDWTRAWLVQNLEETDHSKSRWWRSAICKRYKVSILTFVGAAICVFGIGRPPSSSTNYATEPMSQRSPHDTRRRPELRDELRTRAQPFTCSLWTTSPGRARKERRIDHSANNGGLGGGEISTFEDGVDRRRGIRTIPLHDVNIRL
ncbi:hypothetical protein EV361DRAFT_399788 [Lentinula raphanica]|nr:hypothetical protein EV361DRAFT_399788 [Lentinula raphanica]